MSKAVGRYKDDFVDLVIDWNSVVLMEKRPLYINIYFSTAGHSISVQAPTEEINNWRYERLYTQWEQIIWSDK